MKTIRKFSIPFVIMIISVIISCQKESNSKNVISNSDIFGIWVNTSNAQDTIQINDILITRWNFEANCYCHFYKYYIKTDSIILTYNGIDKVYILPYHKKLYLNNSKDSLTIENFHAVHPAYQGDIFKKIKK
jgi:hypothetical protein